METRREFLSLVGRGTAAVGAAAAVASYAHAAEYPYRPSVAATYATANYNLAYGGAGGNPFPNYANNCTHFVSQCLMAGLVNSYKAAVVYQNRGSFVADKGSPLSWYFLSDADRAKPAWAGADGLYRYAAGNAPAYKGLHFTPVPLDYMKVAVGDVVFANWDTRADNVIDHSMIVTGLYSGEKNLNRIRLTYQTRDTTDKGLGDIKAGNPRAAFFVYRPVVV